MMNHNLVASSPSRKMYRRSLAQKARHQEAARRTAFLLSGDPRYLKKKKEDTWLSKLLRFIPGFDHERA